MNINKIIWLGSVFILLVCLIIFLSKLVIVFLGLRVFYVVGIGGVIWFFKE